MNRQIIGSANPIAHTSGLGLAPLLGEWLDPSTVPANGGQVAHWLLPLYHQHVQDFFGFHALQLGATQMPTLANSRIPHKWCLSDNTEDPLASLYASASALPFFEATLDLVTLPLTLDAHSDPESVIDEVARVLVPEGRVVISGLNARSLWGFAHHAVHRQWPTGIEPFGYKRLLAALSDLGLAVEFVQFGAFGTPGLAFGSQTLLAKAAMRLWPQWGGLYFVVAKKRVLGVRPKRRLPWRMPKLSGLSLNPYPNPNPKLNPNASGLRKLK